MSLKTSFEQLSYSQAMESDSLARQWLADNQQAFGHFINGQFTSFKKPTSDAHHKALPVLNPAKDEVLAHIDCATEPQVDNAVAAAQKALPKWQALGGMGRAKVLYNLARTMQKQARLLAVLETLNNGKPIRESRDGDIPLAIRHFYHHAGWAKLQDTEFKEYQPIGVVGQIIPWNFPLLMLAWKIAPALAMGNTLVLKPAEQTPLTAMLFAKLCQQSGMPDGVVNIINGDGTTGAYLAQHPKLNKVAFTGSTQVGKAIRKSTAGQGKKLSLELGGKSPFIVFDDADLDAAIEGLVDSIWFNQGEVCCAGSRLLVQASVENTLHDKLKARMAKLVTGDPLDKSIDIGVLVSATQFKQVQDKVSAGLTHGGTLYQPNQPDAASNCYPPTLITDLDTNHPLIDEEIFGPVLVSMSFRTHQEAIELANNSRYGLAASVWSENINLALHVAPKLKAGVVWINSHNQFDAACGFGGVKESGFGREGGKEGLYEYLQPTWYTQQAKQTVDSMADTHQSPIVPTIMPTTNGAPPSVLDHTLKFYIGGKQQRPDSGHSYATYDVKGKQVTWVGEGNRKDIRNAVAAADKAASWGNLSGHGRAQIIYYLAENLVQDSAFWLAQLQQLQGLSKARAQQTLDSIMARLFTYAAWADKYDGQVHQAPYRMVTLAMPEPKGVIAFISPKEQPFLSGISLLAPALAMGNRVVWVPPKESAALILSLVPLLERSDIPPGVINIVAGCTQTLGQQLAGHAQVDALWYWGEQEAIKQIETISAQDLKTTWCHQDDGRNWLDDNQSQGHEFLRQSTEVKNIWTPYGE